MPNIDLDSGNKISNSKGPNTKFDSIFPEKDNVIHIFTDGSKLNENNVSSVGFATWSKDTAFNSSYKILDKASIYIYTAECKALIKFIDRITDKSKCEFLIFSDSKRKMKGIFHFEQFGNIKDNKPWFNNIRLSRKAIVLINRIRCGHGEFIDNIECKILIWRRYEGNIAHVATIALK
ncbi:hypothetical protein TSAR_008577 [Trichomalopsis sarcophagae]|uniref:Uncharacterized protein n=1 Tax=Trichomalopsis sarcophagae TaxID=543379 RepID=A0A232FBC4_9HYME|nr:hypothetical protein TSAR_008577 [Trichomalopsis sarcophagae]